MINPNDNLWDATFIPGTGPDLTDEMLRLGAAKRLAGFVAFCMRLMATQPALLRDTDFTDRFKEFTSSPADVREQIMNDPIFRMCFRQAVKVQADRNALREIMIGIPLTPPNYTDDGAASSMILVDGQPICLQRFDADPLLAELAGPEYVFPTERRMQEFEANVTYPISYFKTVVEIVLDRIRISWPEAYVDLPKFVRVIVDMIDGAHTSYSATEHSGIIFVSTDNSPLVALEEFVIHEFGHQILYNVMELDAIVEPLDNRIYVLPWSGNRRDLYGYFHAFYIYILIVNYLTRVKFRSRREQDRIAARKKHVVHGLKAAVEDLNPTIYFTSYGRHLFDNLALEVEKLD